MRSIGIIFDSELWLFWFFRSLGESVIDWRVCWTCRVVRGGLLARGTAGGTRERGFGERGEGVRLGHGDA